MWVHWDNEKEEKERIRESAPDRRERKDPLSVSRALKKKTKTSSVNKPQQQERIPACVADDN